MLVHQYLPTCACLQGDNGEPWEFTAPTINDNSEEGPGEDIGEVFKKAFCGICLDPTEKDDYDDSTWDSDYDDYDDSIVGGNDMSRQVEISRMVQID